MLIQSYLQRLHWNDDEVNSYKWHNEIKIWKLQLLWGVVIFFLILFYFILLYSFLSHFISWFHNFHPCNGCMFVVVVVAVVVVGFLLTHLLINLYIILTTFFCFFCVYFLQLSFTTMAIINSSHFTSVSGLPTAARKVGAIETNSDKTNFANFPPSHHHQKRTIGFKSYDRAQLIQKLNKLVATGANSHGGYNGRYMHGIYTRGSR